MGGKKRSKTSKKKESLPPPHIRLFDTFLHIAQFCDERSIVALRRTNHHLLSYASAPLLWSSMFLRDFNSSKADKKAIQNQVSVLSMASYSKRYSSHYGGLFKTVATLRAAKSFQAFQEADVEVCRMLERCCMGTGTATTFRIGAERQRKYEEFALRHQTTLLLVHGGVAALTCMLGVFPSSNPLTVWVPSDFLSQCPLRKDMTHVFATALTSAPSESLGSPTILLPLQPSVELLASLTTVVVGLVGMEIFTSGDLHHSHRSHNFGDSVIQARATWVHTVRSKGIDLIHSDLSRIFMSVTSSTADVALALVSGPLPLWALSQASDLEKVVAAVLGCFAYFGRSRLKPLQYDIQRLVQQSVSALFVAILFSYSPTMVAYTMPLVPYMTIVALSMWRSFHTKYCIEHSWALSKLCPSCLVWNVSVGSLSVAAAAATGYVAVGFFFAIITNAVRTMALRNFTFSR